MKQSPFRMPISIKLVSATVLLILATVAPIASRNSELFEESFGKSQQDANAELANSKASEVDGLLLNKLEKIKTVTNLLLQTFQDEEQRRRALDLVYFRDLDLVNIEIYGLTNGRPVLYRRETNEAYLSEFSLDRSYIDRLRSEKPLPLMAVFADKDQIRVQNSTLPKGVPLFTLGVPFPDTTGIVRHIAIADLRLDRLQKAFALAGARTLYLIDQNGSVLAHSDDKLVVSGADFSNVPIVQEAVSRKTVASKGQKRFLEPLQSKWFIGAYSKTSLGLTVVAQAPEEIILEPARLVKREAFEIAGYALSGALFFVVLLSLSLTRPIERLHEALLRVGAGDFTIRTDVRSNDEVGDLATGFNFMVEGLRERDKVKSILTKFHGSSVTEDLLKRDVDLGGTRKEVTVFFSDIRDFTKFSEGHTPEEVVEMLNEYFHIMVTIITNNHGIVDKFVGDAIMAVWGAPESAPGSDGQSTLQDRQFAIKASLEMRMALAELNERRIQRGQAPIRIGIGLHSGPAISGTIGSTERMEYTVIGDTVNMASRIESSTKAFGADLLVSESVAAGLEQRFVFEFAGSAEVKGKSQPVAMYKVRGYFSATGESHLLRTDYSDFEAQEADKVKIAS